MLVYPENGGYYLKHPDSGKVVAVSSEDLSTKMDQPFLSLSRKLEAEGNYEEAAVVLQDLQENGGDLPGREEDTDSGIACGGIVCNHPHCVYTGIPGKCVYCAGCHQKHQDRYRIAVSCKIHHDMGQQRHVKYMKQGIYG